MSNTAASDLADDDPQDLELGAVCPMELSLTNAPVIPVLPYHSSTR